MIVLSLFSTALATVPDGYDVGFGLGITAPAANLAPNTVSARIAAMDTLVVEPSIDAGFSSSGSVSDIGGTETRSRNSNARLGAGLGLRYHVASRDPVALVFSFTPFASISQNSSDPDVDANDDVTRTTSITAGGAWGLGTVFQPGGPWTLSADVNNPFVSFTRSATRSPNDDLTATNTINGGLVFAPSVRFMAHLWF